MNKNHLQRILLSAFALAVALSAPMSAPAQDAKQPYPTMAPLEQYLMDRDAEIARLVRPGSQGHQLDGFIRCCYDRRVGPAPPPAKLFVMSPEPRAEPHGGIWAASLAPRPRSGNPDQQ